MPLWNIISRKRGITARYSGKADDSSDQKIARLVRRDMEQITMIQDMKKGM